MRPIALAALAAVLLGLAIPAQAGIRTDGGALQNPDAITVLRVEAGQTAPVGTAG
jgi:hypothetical protein